MWLFHRKEIGSEEKFEVGFYDPKGEWMCQFHATSLDSAIEVCGRLNGGCQMPDSINVVNIPV